MYDIIIAGAGPAGSTLARLCTEAGMRTLVLERRDLLKMKGPVDKCCGGLIAPDAQAALAEMGLGVPREVLAGPQLFSVRTMDIPGRTERYYQRHYININRPRFDSWLLSLVPQKAEIVTGAVVHEFIEHPDRVIVRYFHKGKKKEAQGAWLVGADGAASVIRKKLFPRQFRREYIAIQEYFKTGDPHPFFSAIFDEAITDFYSWTIPKDGILLAGGAFPVKANPQEGFALLIRKLRGLGLISGKAVSRDGAMIIRPASAGEITNGRGRVLLCGEAAGYISPSSAEGFSYAFRSALALADAFSGGGHPVEYRYRSNTAALRHNITGKILKSPFMFNPMLRKMAMRSGVMSLAVRT